jgi:hypothetical protein
MTARDALLPATGEPPTSVNYWRQFNTGGDRDMQERFSRTFNARRLQIPGLSAQEHQQVYLHMNPDINAGVQTPERRTVSGGQMGRLTASMSDASISPRSPPPDADADTHRRFRERLEQRAVAARTEAQRREERLRKYNNRDRQSKGGK